jgi:hypothetical protein
MVDKKIACVLAVMALCGTITAGAADYTILEEAEKVETTVYGTTQTGSLNDRIDALDKLLNGQDTVSGTIQNQTDQLYKDVYGNTGSDLSLLATVNLMQWKYSGQITEEPLLARVETLEEGINGKASTGSLAGRIHSLRANLLGNTKYTSQTVTIPASTIVTMKNLDELNSKTVEKGQIVRFAVASDVTVDDVVVIPAGMEADGTITNARKAGRFGRDGKIEITYSTVRASDGTPVKLTVGEKTKEEYKRTAGAVGASAAGAIILGPVGLVSGLFVTGHNVDFPAGTEMYAETKEDTDVVGFRQTDGADQNMAAANRAASGVAVPASQAAYGTSEDNGMNVKQADSSNVTPVNLEDNGAGEPDQTTVTITRNDNTSGGVNE